MEFATKLPEPDTNARPGTRSLPFEIDLNETPPRETPAADEAAVAPAAKKEGVFSGEVLCASCGRTAEVKGDTVVCCGCGRGFHMRCLGTKEDQKSREWKCFKCLLSNGSEKLRSGVGFLDMNASPPREAEGEGFLEEVPSYGGGGGNRVQRREAEQNGDDKRHSLLDVTFTGHSLNPSVTTSNILHLENGFNLLKASRVVTQIPKSGFEDIVQCRQYRTSDLSSPQISSHCTPLTFHPETQSELYLEGLRECIHKNRGILGDDGWHVEFVFCKNRCKTVAVYCAPDGSRFESMPDVAGHLGLLRNYRSLETEDISGGFALQKGLHSNRRRKEILRFHSSNNYRENQNAPKRSAVVGISSGIGIVGHRTGEFEISRSRMEADSMEHDSGFELFQDRFPLQFEDFFVLSLGKVDPRPSYHNTSQICPVGYRSCWHDKITGSIFVSEVIDGGDAGPIFEVRRYPCSTQPIPISSTVLFLRQKSDSDDGHGKVANDDSTTSGMDDDENLSIQMLLTEDNPPHLEDIDFQNTKSSTTESSCCPHRIVNIIPDAIRLGDSIGEFLVEGRSSSLVWEMASQTLVCACHEVFKRIDRLQFCCKHNMNGMNVKAADNIDSLSKFCYLSGPTDIPCLIRSNNEFDRYSEMLMKWLQQDRFGLDVEFVQEILEQLPGVHACSEYKFLNKRNQNSGSQTVRSGFLLARRSNVQDGNSLSCKRPRKPLVEDSCLMKSLPLGKPLTAKLPAYLLGDVLQAWEFLWRFSEILSLEEPFSFQELENELLNPWLDTINPLDGTGNEIQNCGDVTLCTGAALRMAHSSMLKVVIGELLLKVAGYVDPNSDAGECKSKRGKKKDADNSLTSKKMKFDMLQINELTWPELARRYILVVLSKGGNLHSAEITCHESTKIFHCLQGDGGTLCGSLKGVAGMEADAQLLAEALKQVFGSSVKKFDFVRTDQDEYPAMSTPKTTEVNESEVPAWAQALEPVRKLPTNVGARIRKCVHDALTKNPPEWAKKIMEHSISKEVYKGNASGPTKRAIVSLLGEVNHKQLHPKPEKKDKVKSVHTVSDIIMKQCRIVLRRTAAEDEDKVFCNLLGRTLVNPNDNGDEGLLGYSAMVSRPLDFRTIDIRLAAGAYGGSHEAFLEDVQEVWNNIRIAYAEQSNMIDLANALYQKFEELYEKEVLTLIQMFSGSANSLCLSNESEKEACDVLLCANESSLPKAPWDDGVCKVCGVDKDDDNVLLCDTCDSEYHTYCLNPPLARIPEGNWYCPSCVAGKSKSQGTFRGTQVRLCQKKRYRGELTRNFMESLSRLARAMESKEYWEFNIEERILLMKFLCDETLNSTILRDHLDHCGYTSLDLQQKLRFLSSEWKNLKIREEVLAANLEKANAVHNRVGELVPDGLASVLTKDGKLMGQLSKRSNSVSCCSGNFQNIEDGTRWNGLNDYNEQSCRSFSKNISEKSCASNRSQSFKRSDTIGPLLTPNQVPEGLVSSDVSGNQIAEHEHMFNGHHSSLQSDANALQANNLEMMSSLKHEISVLQDSMASLESEFQKVSVRKEFLGRDSAGRVYWVFGRPDTYSLLVVNGSMEVRQSKVTAHGGPTESSSNLRSSQYGMLNLSSSRKPNTSSMYDTSAWVSYQSDAEIQGLVGWLRDGDARERELKEHILHWQSKLKDTNNAGNHVQNEKQKQPSCLELPTGLKARDSNLLVTKAVTALEKKHGPCLGSEAIDISKKQGEKSKVTCEGKMYRCECLELIWPSRHHCLSCHKTCSSSEELESHSDGTCSAGSPILENSKVNEDSRKGKMVAETPVKKRPDDNGIGRAPKSEKNEIGSNLSKIREPECPFDLKEISAKFVTQNSLNELVRDVGLIGSGGTPSFVSNVSPYLSDPTLRLVPTKKNEANMANKSTDWEDQLQQSIQGINDMNCDSNSNNFPRCVGNDKDEETSKVERLISNSTNERDQFFSRRNKSPAHGFGNCCVIPESSLRRLVGRVSQILRQLKINLLDMDAALPEEALRPSMVHLEKRSAWRAFVKSAGSIYEMVQATIVLENMIKADYVKKDWWYWSSLTAAANISTLSALALRVYTLDAAIIFEKPTDSTETPKPGCETETPSNSDKTSNMKASKTLNDSTDCSKPKTRPNKRRKDSSG
ncbi:methyl-CpG-binding domain-containing protein 9-like isoform X1 [Camellia sinensis]|uniref:methyl-CpG-binding domain-containing protein 9-like isoform X1 n=1 Tax=Camellia sinensis TaxID=4442 RepID=UPI0010362E82|nr:methyl-CpG-binding domain-containing protein 9-like isoform X1 [Camellia sinensis]